MTDDRPANVEFFFFFHLHPPFGAAAFRVNIWPPLYHMSLSPGFFARQDGLSLWRTLPPSSSSKAGQLAAFQEPEPGAEGSQCMRGVKG